MISVAMATYNGEKYILEQIESIYNQTLPANEVIICDDGSTDKTVNIINEFIKKHNLEGKWKLYRNENSLGFIKNFLKAISLTNGDIIFLSDQDDIFLHNKFEIMVKFFKNKNECKVLNANYSIIDTNSKNVKSFRKLAPTRKKPYNKLSFKEYLYYSNYPGFSMAFKKDVREVLKEININNVYGHDIMINLLGVEMEGCYEINDILSLYRIHNNNTSGAGSIISNTNINSRINQKNKELDEYEKLQNFCVENSVKNIDVNFLKFRINELEKRIKYLKKKNIFKLIVLLFTTKAYPKKTILGDILYLLNSFYKI